MHRKRLRHAVPCFFGFLLAAPVSLEGQRLPVDVEFASGGSRLQGRFFPAEGTGHRTLLLLPDLPASGDVLELGHALSGAGVHVLTFSYRGTGESEGFFTVSGVSQDIDAARRWLRSEDATGRFGLDPNDVVIGGYGFGGGLGMAYASTDLAITDVFSIAGYDLSIGIARYAEDPVYATQLETLLGAGLRWQRGDFFAFVKEAMQGTGRWDLRGAAPQLARKRLLLVGGLDDRRVPVEEHVLPLYRTLRGLGTRDLDMVVYQDDHAFADVREELAAVLADWIGE